MAFHINGNNAYNAQVTYPPETSDSMRHQLLAGLATEPGKSWSITELFDKLNIAVSSVDARELVWDLIDSHEIELTEDRKLRLKPD
jgi:hypothetical protein